MEKYLKPSERNYPSVESVRKFRIVNPDILGGVFWDASQRVWRTYLHGGYTTYTTHERARKAAEKLSWLHANLRVEEDKH